MLKKYLGALKSKLIPLKEYEVYDKSIIPVKHLRFNGVAFRDDAFYIRSAEEEANRIINRLGYTSQSRILEIGCGKGRLATGLIRLVGAANYTGLDVHRPSIKWCKKHIEKHDPSYHFEYLDVASIRYNKKGSSIDESFKFDIEDESIDIIYIWGVFTNMAERVMRIYLNDLKRMLAPGGKVFFTAFIEENVPDVSVNPEGYRNKVYKGPLQVVRYEKNYIFSLISKTGLEIEEFNYGNEFDGQSEFYLTSAKSTHIDVPNTESSRTTVERA